MCVCVCSTLRVCESCTVLRELLTKQAVCWSVNRSAVECMHVRERRREGVHTSKHFNERFGCCR